MNEQERERLFNLAMNDYQEITDEIDRKYNEFLDSLDERRKDNESISTDELFRQRTDIKELYDKLEEAAKRIEQYSPTENIEQLSESNEDTMKKEYQDALNELKNLKEQLENASHKDERRKVLDNIEEKIKEIDNLIKEDSYSKVSIEEELETIETMIMILKHQWNLLK